MVPLSLLVGLNHALGIGHNITIGSFGSLFLRNAVNVQTLALRIGHNITIGSFGSLFLRNVVDVRALALNNSTVNLRERETLSDRDATGDIT
jgi:hypothetical protein